MDILDALSRENEVRHITTRHEQGAAFMADVYGRLTGRAAVAMATLGPGATNLVTGIADAFLDHAPMVAITGQTGLDKLHKESHQYVDIVRMLEPVTKWNQRVEQAGAVPEIVRKAFRVAELEKPGPTHIELPENLAATPVDADRPTDPADPALLPRADRRGHRARRSAPGRVRPADRPRRQRRPPPGRRRMSCARFAKGLHVPVAATFMGKGAIDDRSHLSLMAVGLQARDHVLSGFDRADLVLAVGYDLVEYGPARWNPDGRKRIIHIDTQPAEVDASYQPEVELIGDIEGSLRRLLAAVMPTGVGGRDASERHATHGDARPPGPADGAARGPARVRPRRRLADQAAEGDRRPAARARAGGHRRQRRRRPQDLGRPAVPGLRAQHGDHLERLRRDGHLAARRDRGQARPPRPAGRGAVRRRRLPDELPGARDGAADRRERHRRRLARRRLRPHRLEAARTSSGGRSGSSSATRTSSPMPSRSGSPGSGRHRRPTSTRP